jgi:hypothetical protein
MTCENEEQKPSDNYKSSLEIIHKDANESLKFFHDNINSNNTRLGIIIGFDTSFSAFLAKIPNQRCLLQLCDSLFRRKNNILLPFEQFFNLLVNSIDWLLNIKPLIGILLISSLIFATSGLLPEATHTTLSPNRLLDRARNNSEERLLEGIIDIRSDTIQRLEKLVNEKASKFRYALVFLEAATIVAIFFMITSINRTE